MSCSPMTKLPTPVNPMFNTQTRPKTALDVLNDTIIKSLGTSTSSSSAPSTPIKSSTPNQNNFPLNLVKILPSPSSSTHQVQILAIRLLITASCTRRGSPKKTGKKLSKCCQYDDNLQLAHTKPNEFILVLCQHLAHSRYLGHFLGI
jgi:hypothetical protein